ncbi:fluoride efflux transporter FluC [Streptomyces sp. NBC_01014]|uniref:fluoride efflux transporter FluC n=1 Tax=Streptomyces sp. NBC_01014 TaxID=2903719 RepID=UPI00386722A3|nr:CrcB family protein [Streptomyces sp. NBC_01014]
MTWLLVAVGACVGAMLRYLTDRWVHTRYHGVFPWGTFTANMAAALVLGVVTGAVLSGHASHDTQLLLGTGLCGALSTYSTFSYETLALAASRPRTLAVTNLVVTVLAGLGSAVATALFG